MVPVALAALVVVLVLATLAVLVLWSTAEAPEVVEELRGENQRMMAHLMRVAAEEEEPGSQSHSQALEVVWWPLLVARLPAAQEIRR